MKIIRQVTHLSGPFTKHATDEPPFLHTLESCKENRPCVFVRLPKDGPE